MSPSLELADFFIDARAADGLCAFEITGGLEYAMAYGSAGQVRRAAQDMVDTCRIDKAYVKSGSATNIGSSRPKTFPLSDITKQIYR